MLTWGDRLFLAGPSRARLRLITLLVGLLSIPGTLAAQGTGRVVGQVLNAQTSEPVASAQISVLGTPLGTASDANGRFLLLELPAGEYELQVNSVGYRQHTEQILVASGQTIQLTIELAVSAIALDELVVTGQALRGVRREIGTSIASIDAENLDVAPITSASQLLQSRVPGVTILPSGGEVGRGSRIVLRGPGSLSQDIEPIIYVDGVRFDNDKFAGLNGTPTSWTGLDDIDPADIERIEVVKGAAAATLYGTEASGGVIQIFTRQGTGDRQSWNYRTEFGLSHSPRDHWDVGVYSDYLYDTFIKTVAPSHSQRLRVSGSVDGFNYNVTGIVRGAGSVIPNNSSENASFRTNMGFQPSDDLRITVNTAYMTRKVEQPSGGNRAAGLGYNALRGGPRGIAHEPINLQTRERFQRQGRFTAKLQVDLTLWDRFEQSLAFGADISNNDNTTFDEFGSYRNSGGRMYNWRRQRKGLSFDYRAGVQADITEGIRSSTAFGFQAYSMDDDRTRANATGFPAPGITAPIAAGSVTGLDSKTQRKSVGFYLEEQVGFADLFFVTVGARADAHSAFGSDHAYQIYPKIDASYNISDTDFWPADFGTLRLRAAYGTAGRQPGAYDKDMTWEPVTGLDGLPAVSAHNLGSPDLAPEVTHEFEGGFDLSVFDDRIALEYTFYRQRTKGALYDYQAPPSLGFVKTQLRNVGEIANFGHEIGLTADLVRRGDFTWTARTGISTNRNRVVTLSGGAPVQVQYTQWIREGYPIASFFHDRYILIDGKPVLASEHYAIRDENGNPIIDALGDTLRQEGWDYIGSPFPKLTLNLGSTFTLTRNLSMNFLLDFKGGHYLESSLSRHLSTDRVAPGDPFYDPNDPSTEIYGPNAPIGWWCVHPSDPIDEMRCSHGFEEIRGNHVYPADIWRLREVSLSYRLPPQLAQRFGARSATLSVSGRNLWRHQKYPGLEAEANYATAQLLRNQSYYDPPIPMQFITALSVNF